MEPRQIYFAGDLFDHKDISGNLLLAEAVKEVSQCRYSAILPQDSESNNLRSVHEIRDRDLEMLFCADCIVANFDGCELDSGTVVEFCFAKMLDLPAVLLRTDFRVKGDNGKYPWNLMCSGYPRTEVLLISAMEQYHRLRQEFPQDTVKAMHRETAKMIVDALDQMFMVKSRFTTEEACFAMKFAADTAGATVPELFPEDRIKELTEIKKQRQVY